MKRKVEVISTWVLMIICVVLLGGFSLVMNTVKEKEFTAKIYPMFQSADLSASETFQQFRTLGMWFGLTLMAILVMNMIALYLLSQSKRRWISAVLYGLSGVCLLIGTQFLLYPVAFFFFVLAGIVLFHKQKLEEPQGGECK